MWPSLGAKIFPHRHPDACPPEKQLKTALESLSSTPDDLDVSRFELLNGGSLWTVTFPAANGDVASLDLDAAGLAGTDLLATVSEETSGGGPSGSFYLYSNGGSSAGFPIDAEGAQVSTEDMVNNGTGRSEPLPWNAAEDDVRVAIEGLLPNYVSPGNIYSILNSGAYIDFSGTGPFARTVAICTTYSVQICLLVEV